MKFPCEIIIWYILPTLRAELARELINLGLSQKDASERLGITQAAVSQYVGKKRGKDIKLGEDIKESIRDLARDLVSGNANNLVPRVCEICRELKKDEKICELHKEHDLIPEGCNVCLK